jgi:uncharacterized membrane protein YqiK
MPDFSSVLSYVLWGVVVIAAIILIWQVLKSFVHIGPTELGLVTKRFGGELKSGVIALNGETGYQDQLLRSGWHLKPRILFRVERFPFVQIDTDEIGVVIAQIGAPLPSGTRSGRYNDSFGDYEDVRAFIDGEGQKGVQRRTLPPGTVAAINPVAFLVVTSRRVYGKLVDPSLMQGGDDESGGLSPATFGLEPKDLKRVTIEPGMIGIVETLEGPSLDSDQVAGRLEGFSDIKDLETQMQSETPYTGTTPDERLAWLTAMSTPLMDRILSRHLESHKSYQDYQAFLDNDGRMGVQHDVLSTGSYLLNPFLVRVRVVEMVEVDQSEVAVIRSAVGLPAADVSGNDFKFGSLTMPGHRGLWAAALRTGLYPLNTEVYEALSVPTNIITLSWSEAETAAQSLDSDLKSIEGTSNDGFSFTLELQVQVHVPADQAPHLISLVGDMTHLVNGILQPIVGAFFRTALQQRSATEFITARKEIEADALTEITSLLTSYHVQTRAVLIQAVKYPEAIAKVLQEREIANQQIVTYDKQKEAEEARITMEATRGKANAQSDLARAGVEVEIATKNAEAKVAEAEGTAQVTNKLATAEAARITAIGEANGEAIKAEGEGRAAGFTAQQVAIGKEQTAIIAMLSEIANGAVKITPDILSSGGGGSSETLGSVLTMMIAQQMGLAASNGQSGPHSVERPAVTTGAENAA